MCRTRCVVKIALNSKHYNSTTILVFIGVAKGAHSRNVFKFNDFSGIVLNTLSRRSKCKDS